MQHFKIVAGETAGPHVTLTASNGEVLSSSEKLSNLANANKNIEAQKRAVVSDILHSNLPVSHYAPKRTIKKIYVASSWRNEIQPKVVDFLRAAGYEVYDFKNPPRGTGFSWSSVDPNWQDWTTKQYREALRHDASEKGYASDMEAMIWADACVLVLPCGRSAHAEAGWFSGSGKPVVAYIPDECEAELMYKMFSDVTDDLNELSSLLLQH